MSFVFSSRIATWASPSRERTIAGPCFSGSRLVFLVNFLHISVSFNQSEKGLELDSDGGLLLSLAIYSLGRCFILQLGLWIGVIS